MFGRRDILGAQTLWATALTVSLLTPLIAVTAPKEGASLGVVFPPWTPLTQIAERVAAADGGVLAASAFGGVAVVVDRAPTHPDPLSERLRAAGAFILFSADAAAYLCGGARNGEGLS